MTLDRSSAARITKGILRVTPSAALRGRRPSRGQSVVEFALVIPIVLVLLMGIIEFALVLNALLGINFASREAALVAAEAGSAAGSDCVILRKVQDSVGPPSDSRLITAVRIYKATTAGVDTGTGNDYDRAGTISCPLPGDPTATLTFRRVTNGYPETARCNYLAGCQGPVRPLDHIGVEITYNYSWHTPLSYLINLGGNGYTMVKSNAMRMEPIL